MRQPSANVAGGRELRRIPLRASVLDPLGNQPLLLARHSRVVGEVSVFGIGIPRRHPLVVDHFAHRLGPGRHVLVRGQRKRRDLPRAMALNAPRLDDPRDSGSSTSRCPFPAGGSRGQCGNRPLPPGLCGPAFPPERRQGHRPDGAASRCSARSRPRTGHRFCPDSGPCGRHPARTLRGCGPRRICRRPGWPDPSEWET